MAKDLEYIYHIGCVWLHTWRLYSALCGIGGIDCFG